MRRLIDAGVVMRDGIRLSADVYLPVDDKGPVPAVLVRTPYNNSEPYYTDQARFFTQHGYAFVIQDCRGKFDSGGEFRPWFNEGADGYDTQLWVGTQPWCDGNVGTVGSSYDGATQWLSAPLANPHLRAMVPAVVPSDYWAQDHYVGGAFAHGLNLSWAVRNAARSRRELTPPEIQQLWWHLPLATGDAAAGTDIPWYREWLDHPAYDDFWRMIATREHLSTLDVPALNVCGWYDAYAGAALEHFTGVRANGTSIGERIVGEIDFGPDAEAGMRDLELRFLDRWLRGIGADELDAEPPVRIFVMGENRWRFEHEWPLARTRWTDLFLGPDAALTTYRPLGDSGTDADWFVYDPANPVMTTGGNHSLVHPAISVGPFDQRSVEARTDVLVYTGPVLDEPIEITGHPSAVLFVSSSAPDTDLVARLVDVHPDGRSINLCEGILRLRYRDSIERPTLMTAGNVYQVQIDLSPTSNVFKPGHRVRLQVTSSDFPRVDRNLNTGGPIGFETDWEVAHTRIHRSAAHASRLHLPVIPRA
jgi:uncharacterized protein